MTNSYYSTSWQDLEDDVYNPCGGSTTVSTYTWGFSYIDDIVERDQNVNGGAITRIYAQQDANHDVTALVNASGAVLERFIYDPYGSMKVLNASTWATRSDGYSWVYTFQGGRYDPVSGKINFRNRDLDPVTGTWMEQDNAYWDGPNLYQYVLSDPVTLVDPSGRDGVSDSPVPTNYSAFTGADADAAYTVRMKFLPYMEAKYPNDPAYRQDGKMQCRFAGPSEYPPSIVVRKMTRTDRGSRPFRIIYGRPEAGMSTPNAYGGVTPWLRSKTSVYRMWTTQKWHILHKLVCSCGADVSTYWVYIGTYIWRKPTAATESVQTTETQRTQNAGALAVPPAGWGGEAEESNTSEHEAPEWDNPLSPPETNVPGQVD